MSANPTLTKFHWEPQPEAGALINELVERFLSACPQAAELAKRMHDHTGNRFKDWVDFIEVDANDAFKARLVAAGFSHRPVPGGPQAYEHPGAIFPTVVLGKGQKAGIKVDSVADFLAAQQIAGAEIVGEPLGQFRMARVFRGQGAEMWAVKRLGWRGFTPPPFDAAKAIASLKHLESFRTRERDWDSDAQGYAEVNLLVDGAIKDLGVDWTCSLFFEAERRYWQSRNKAAQVQKSRQDRLGLGWANHDHHTYRCSRENFGLHVALLEKLGLRCRESFYAGAEAGWGAQVMEQPVAGITTFNDVDMSPEELMVDFAHEGLSPVTDRLGTVGLWCALHGEAMLQAGMHHLECQFDWHALADQLERRWNVRTMAPFTTFPYLRQAFTEGEHWPVDSKRLDRLLERGLITRVQAEQFRVEGALGSHLENLERNDGFKGFNQKGVSDIIARTDPRKQMVAAGA